MKRLCLLILVLALAVSAAAAENDVYTLPLDLSPGMELDKAHYESKWHYKDPTIEMTAREDQYEGVRYWIAEVEISHPSQLRTMPAYSFARSSSAEGMRLSRRANAVLACNGDYWWRDVKWKGNYVLRQGQLYMHSLTGQTDLLLVDEEGDFHVIRRATEDNVPLPAEEGGPVYYQGKQICNAFCFGPVLVEDGKACDIIPNERIASETQMARMAICQFAKRKYAIICTCRGSMTLREFAAMLENLGVQVAYNLDGGASAMMMTGGSMINTNPTTRELSDIIYFASAWPGGGK